MIIYTDAGSRGNPGKSACAYVVVKDDKIIEILV
jgi:ribonuclease HI